MEIVDISWVDLILSEFLLLIPILIFLYFRTGLVKSILISSARMTVQLLLVGVYLGYIFELNNSLINISWILVMIVIAGFTVSKRSELNFKYFAIPLFLSMTISLFTVMSVFLGFTVRLESLYQAQYFIPITGMMIGNILQSNIIGANAFFHSVQQNITTYQFSVACGASPSEATFPLVRDAFKKAFNPMIAQMGVMGLIALPGMMTGQILGGNDPQIAIKYQIMMMISIFTVSVLSVFLTIQFSKRFIFDKHQNFRPEVLK